MVNENTRIASEVEIGEFTDNEKELLKNVVKEINSKMKVGCTGCGYCMPCPQNVDIPGTFATYNRMASDGKKKAKEEHIMCTAFRKDSTSPQNCIECGKCERRCPQHIEIRKELKKAKKQLEGPFYKIVRKVIEIFKLY